MNDHSVFLESTHGETLNGNIFYLVKELCTDEKYKDFSVTIALKKEALAHARAMLRRHRIDRVRIVSYYSREYFVALCTSKFLFNDTSFLPFFVKKPEQIYLNTWHGTPLKYLGKKVKAECHKIGNIQKNFLQCDYLLYPNEYTRDHMIEDYMLADTATGGKVVLNGYPRNTAFFDEALKQSVRERCALNGVEVICYMPTWRGLVGDVHNNKALSDTIANLTEMDRLVKDHQRLYCNLHPYFKGKIDFSKFEHIREFPTEYETYEFLSIADVLVTDYSSVFFDFATTGKKILLFAYDKEEYLTDRGLYFPMEDLPFPIVERVDELFECIDEGPVCDTTAFLEAYCSYDHLNATQELLDLVLFGQAGDQIVADIPNNGKRNIVIYAGNLAKNGLTTSIKNLLNHLDLEENNYFLTVDASIVGNYKDELLNLPKGVSYLVMHGAMNTTFAERLKLIRYGLTQHGFDAVRKIYEANAGLEFQRLFGNTRIDHLIHYTSYDYKIVLLFSRFKEHNTIFVHSDMANEIRTRKSAKWAVLEYAYQQYAHVALVTRDLWGSTLELAKTDERFVVVNNLIDRERIKNLVEKQLSFDSYTELNHPAENVLHVLQDSTVTKFVTVGRFSPEKGHERLIRAFLKFNKEHSDTYLIIVGGYGKLYEQTLALARENDHIIIIKDMSNPFALLKACDGFILPSHYEGFGLALAEADIVGLPIVACDVTGPRLFMQKYGGVLVEDSQAGVYEGLCRLYRHEIPKLDVDYESYNQEAVESFLGLLD